MAPQMNSTKHLKKNKYNYFSNSNKKLKRKELINETSIILTKDWQGLYYPDKDLQSRTWWQRLTVKDMARKRKLQVVMSDNIGVTILNNLPASWVQEYVIKWSTLWDLILQYTDDSKYANHQRWYTTLTEWRKKIIWLLQ